MAQRIVAGFAVIISSLLGAAYVASTILYLTPPNPLKAQLLPLIYSIHHPYFAQNWHLFAPNPIKTNFDLAVRCRLRDRITPWHDPYAPLLAAHHRNRFTPLGKVLRMPQNAIYAFLGRNTDEWLPLLCRQKRDLPACRGDHPAMRTQREFGKFLLQRLTSAACDELVGPGRTTAVQVRILQHTPPPFSQRHLPSEAGATSYVTLPWLPYQSWREAGSGERDATMP